MIGKIKNIIKKDKFKSITIAFSLLVFLTGLVITISNGANTHASGTKYKEEDGKIYVLNDDDVAVGVMWCPIGEPYVEIALEKYSNGDGIPVCRIDLEFFGEDYDDDCSKFVKDNGYDFDSYGTKTSGKCQYKAVIADCDEGYYVDSKGICALCPAGYYCPGEEELFNKIECPSGTNSTPGSDECEAIKPTITCEPGEYHNGKGICAPCPTNHYCPGGEIATDLPSGNKIKCPDGTSSEPGSSTLRECLGFVPEPVPTYTVTYNSSGGLNAPNDQTGEIGSSIKLSDIVPTKEGHVFEGWSTTSAEGKVEYQPGDEYNGESIMLHAVWKEIPQNTTCTVTYNSSGGLNAPSDQIGEIGSSIKLSDIVPTKEGHVFEGWSTTSSEGEVEYQPGDEYICNSAMLYAVWTEIQTKNTYVVKYSAQGGHNAPSDQTGEIGSSIKLSNVVPNLIGNTFKGWSTTPKGKVTYQPGDPYVGGDATLYAVWSANAYNIKYNLNGGIASGNPVSAVFGEIITINQPTKKITINCNDNKTGAVIGPNPVANFIFKGWSSSDMHTGYAIHVDEEKGLSYIWNDKNRLVTTNKFKSLHIDEGATVTMNANWEEVSVKLPSISKKDYICNWNTKSTGSGKSYQPGDSYLVSSNVDAVNLYAICEFDNKDNSSDTPGNNPSDTPGNNPSDTPNNNFGESESSNNKPNDENINKNPPTGEIAIFVVLFVGLTCIIYSIWLTYKTKKINN